MKIGVTWIYAITNYGRANDERLFKFQFCTNKHHSRDALIYASMLIFVIISES